MKSIDKRINSERWLREAEAAGEVADSSEYRARLVAKIHAGEITLQQAQAELRRTIRTAKSNGKITQSQARNGRIIAPKETA